MARKRLFNLALILLVVFGMAAPALEAMSRTPVHAADAVAGARAPRITLSTGAVAAGDSITVTGNGFLQGDTISLTIISVVDSSAAFDVRMVVADDAGAFSASYTVSSAAALGNYVLVARGLANRDVARAALTVAAAAPTGDGQQGAVAAPTDTFSPTDTASPAPSDTATESATATSTLPPSATSTPVANSPTSTFPAMTTSTPLPATSTPTSVNANPPGVTSGTTSAHVVLVSSPTVIRAGDAVTLDATGLPPRGAIELALLGGSSSGPIPLASLYASAAGTLHLTKLAIPISTPAGAYAVQVMAQDGMESAQSALTVLARIASIAANPSSFAPQSTIAVTGYGFVANEAIAISLDALDGSSAVGLGEVRADANGSIVATAIHIPFGAAAGQWLLQATGTSSNLQATFPVTVSAETPTLRIDPAAAAPGNPVSLLGQHFQPGEIVSVDMVTVAATVPVGSVTADASGAIAFTGLRLPVRLPSGPVTVVGTGGSSHLTAMARFTVVAPPTGIAANRTSLRPGDHLTLAGSGFIAGETVSIVLDSGAQAPLAMVEAVTDGSGGFSGLTVVIPGVVPAGSYMLTAAGLDSGRQAVVRLVVRAPRTNRPALGIVSSSAAGAPVYQTNPGALLQVAGFHFPPGAPVALRLVGVAGRTAALMPANIPAKVKSASTVVTRNTAGEGAAARMGLNAMSVMPASMRGAPVAANTLASSTSAALATVQAHADGSLGPLGVALPTTLAAGSYTVQAVVGGNTLAAAAVNLRTLRPQLALSTRSIVPGTTVTVRGAHFAPGEQIVLALNSKAVATSPKTILADRSGNFTAHFVAPGTLATGSNAITASGAASRVTATAAIQAHLPPSAHWYFADGDTTRGHGTSMALLNPNGETAYVHMTFLYEGSPARSFTMNVRAHAHAEVNLALAAGSGRRFSIILDADRRIGAESTITYAPHSIVTTLGAPAPATQWYLAEGYTGGTFQEYLQIMNPNSGYATVDTRFLPFNGRPPRDVRFVVRPRSAIQVNVRRYMPLASVGSIVTSDKGVVVSRTMRFGSGGRGAHQTIGSTQAATVWLFGQGDSSSNRQTFLTIANLNQATTAIVTASFLGSQGQPIATRTIFIQPLRRGNIKLNDVLPQAQTSVVITSNVPVVVERAQYDGSPNLDHAYSGSVLLGCNSGSATWLFPNASTAPRENTRIYLFNPSLTADRVQVTFYTDGGRTVNRRMTIPVDASTVINVSQIRDLSGTAVGLQLTSAANQVFVAEQAGDNGDFQSIHANAGIP